MTKDDKGDDSDSNRVGVKGPLPEAALRALAEAEARRREVDKRPALPPEVNGRDGPEPVRYGDWERKGIAVDF